MDRIPFRTEASLSLCHRFQLNFLDTDGNYSPRFLPFRIDLSTLRRSSLILNISRILKYLTAKLYTYIRYASWHSTSIIRTFRIVC